MEIIQVTQFASDEDEWAKLDFVTLYGNKWYSGFIRKTIKKDDEPYIGRVWYKKGSNGKCEIYKYHYDSSD